MLRKANQANLILLKLNRKYPIGIKAELFLPKPDRKCPI
jgi:hypothetical protein